MSLQQNLICTQSAFDCGNKVCFSGNQRANKNSISPQNLSLRECSCCEFQIIFKCNQSRCNVRLLRVDIRHAEKDVIECIFGFDLFQRFNIFL